MMRKVVLILCSSILVSAGVIGSDYYPSTSVSYSSVSTPTIVKTIATTTNKKTNTEPINYTKIIQSPPFYEVVITTKESKLESPDGSQHSTFSKSVDTAYSSFKKFQSTSSNNGDVLGNSKLPSINTTSDYPPIIYNSQSAYSFSSPLVHAVTAPVFSKTAPVHIAYSNDVPQTKTILSPTVTSFSIPFISKTNSLEHMFSNPTITESVSLPKTYTNNEIPLIQTLISPPIDSYETPLPSKTSDLTNYASNKPQVEAQPPKIAFTYSDAPVVSHTSFSGLGTSYAW